MTPTGWPAFRTDPDAARGKELWVLLVCSVGMLIGSVVVGGLMVATSAAFEGFFGQTPSTNAASGLGFLLMFSPVVSWIGLLIGAPFAFLAMRKGIAGWAVAVIAGGLVGIFIVLFYDATPFEIFVPIGCVFGGLFWLSGRIDFGSACRGPAL